MTHATNIGPIRFITLERENRRICRICGAAEETRPYGPNGMRVCFDCAMKDKDEAERQFEKFLEGKP